MLPISLLLAILVACEAYHSFKLVPGFSRSLMPKSASCSCQGKRFLSSLDGRQRYRKSLILSSQDRDIESATKEGYVYDEGTGRFYEKDLEEICRDEYCAIDEESGGFVQLTREEKERIFLDCIQSYYYSGRNVLSDEEFDRLKQDLVWEGSDVIFLNRDEKLFLNAMSAYSKGSPIMSDDDFDALKKKLKEERSLIAVSREPKCYIDTGICTVTFTEDRLRKASLYLPAAFAALVVWIGFTYEATPLRSINPLFNTFLGSPFIWWISKTVTEQILFRNAEIANGPCPSCGYQLRLFFGDILFVEGFKDQGELKCPNCGTELTVLRSNLRVSTLPKTLDQ